MEFRLLGPLQVVDRDRPLSLGGPMQRAVLAMLVLRPNRVVPIESLIDTLWTGTPPASATGTVHAYVSNLRRALEPDRQPGTEARLLVSRPPGYLLQVAEDDVDWLRCERLLSLARAARAAGNLPAADGELGQAASLWRGRPLADIPALASSAGARFDGLALRVVEEHAEVRLALGRHEEVAADLDAVVAEHPLREHLRGLQMVALYRAGRQVDALDVYTDVRRRLAAGHGLDPGVELRELHEQVLRQDPRLAPPAQGVHRVPGSPTPIVERLPELAALRAHLGAAEAGTGRLVTIEGEPGVGKTRLAEEIAAEATARGWHALWGRCVEGGAAPPLWPWTQILRAAGDGRDIAELVPEQSRMTPRLARERLSADLADLLLERAVAQPLLLILDDLHWADDASLALVEFLAAHLAGARILVVATYREIDLPHAPRLSATLGILARLPGADRITVHGLTLDGVATLIRAHTGTDPGTDVTAAVHQRTEGNPFFVTELLRLGDPADLADAALPTGVRDVLRARIARLRSTDARALLDMAALLGREFDLVTVRELAGLAAEDGLVAVDAALTDGLLTAVPDHPGRYRFTHALVRETLVADRSPIQRAEAHAHIGAALLDAHGDDDEHAAEIAEHLWAAQPVGGVERIARAQARAGNLAWAGLAYERAETLLARASGLLRAQPRSTVPAELDLDVHIWLGSLRSARHGHTASAREAFDRARTLATRLDRRADLLAALGGLSATAVVHGDLATAGELTTTMLEEAEEIGGAALARGHLGVGIVAFYRGRLATARAHFARALAVWQAPQTARPAPLHGPPASTCPDVMAPSYDALAAALMGDAAGARGRIAAALRAAEQSTEPYTVAFVHSFHTRLAALSRDRERAAVAAGRAIDVAEAHGFPLLSAHAAIPYGWALAGRGEPEAGLAAIENGLDTLNRSGQRVLTPFHRGLHADVLLGTDAPVVALDLLDDALAESSARGGDFAVPGLHHLRGRALAVLGRTEQAETARRAATAAAHEQGASDPVTLWRAAPAGS